MQLDGVVHWYMETSYVGELLWIFAPKESRHLRAHISYINFLNDKYHVRDKSLSKNVSITSFHILNRMYNLFSRKDNIIMIFIDILSTIIEVKFILLLFPFNASLWRLRYSYTPYYIWLEHIFLPVCEIKMLLCQILLQ